VGTAKPFMQRHVLNSKAGKTNMADITAQQPLPDYQLGIDKFRWFGVVRALLPEHSSDHLATTDFAFHSWSGRENMQAATAAMLHELTHS
jgi:hypothetical protein